MRFVGMAGALSPEDALELMLASDAAKGRWQGIDAVDQAKLLTWVRKPWLRRYQVHRALDVRRGLELGSIGGDPDYQDWRRPPVDPGRLYPPSS